MLESLYSLISQCLVVVEWINTGSPIFHEAANKKTIPHYNCKTNPRWLFNGITALLGNSQDGSIDQEQLICEFKEAFTNASLSQPLR